MLQQHLMEVKEISNSFHLNKNYSKVKNFTKSNIIMNNNKNNLYAELYKFKYMFLCCVFPENIHTSPTEGNLSKIPPCTSIEIPS